MRIFTQAAFAGVSLMALSAPAFAQQAPAEESFNSDEDIVVQARRKDESIQDVPLTVNAVSAQTIEKLNIRDLKDITAVVPGLVLNPGNRTTGALSSLRGLNVDVNSSGNNGTVQFYLNDSPISAGAVLQSLYDIGQIEVLRGPQGTLRGLASPSGSITITTKKPVMDAFGGYVQGSATSRGGLNANAAINVPIVKDVLALRIAGVIEENESNQVRSINSLDTDPFSRTKGVRASLRFQPTDNIEINASYAHMYRKFTTFDQVESASIVNPLLPAAPVTATSTFITARDRLAVEDVGNRGSQRFDIFNWQAQWSFAGQRLNYVGSYVKQDLRSTEPTDKGDYFGVTIPGNPALSNNNGTYMTPSATLNLQNAAQVSNSYVKQETHEVRLSSEERVFGIFDYVAGFFVTKQLPWTDLVRVDALVPPGTVVTGVTNRRGRTIERAFFGNLTAHIGESTEISGGVRFINYKENTNNSSLLVPQGPSNTFKATVWNASIKHKFTDDIMVYATAGSSFRVGSGTNGLILASSGPILEGTVRDPNLASFFPNTPERSKSYEIGVRTSWLDRKLTVNISAFHQDFQNYIFPVAPFYALNNTTNAAVVNGANGTVTQMRSTLAASVPAKVTGVEAEIVIRPSDRFFFSANIAYANARITGGQLPFQFTTLADAQAYFATSPNNQQIRVQTVNQSAGRLAPFTASFQAEYSHPLTDTFSGFVRGLVQVFGNSTNDAQNPYDDVPAYALGNFYAGVRADDGRWELMGYVKNAFNTFRVLSRAASPEAVRVGATFQASNYRLVTVTEPREFGLTLKYAFGSR